jgi:hypothetical protein
MMSRVNGSQGDVGKGVGHDERKEMREWNKERMRNMSQTCGEKVT